MINQCFVKVWAENLFSAIESLLYIIIVEGYSMSLPKPLKLRIVYKGSVANVTGKISDDIIVSDGFVFVQLLQEIFLSYPEIEKKFPAGSLGLLLNGKRPAVEDMLHEGDVVTLIGTERTISVS